MCYPLSQTLDMRICPLCPIVHMFSPVFTMFVCFFFSPAWTYIVSVLLDSGSRAVYFYANILEKHGTTALISDALPRPS